MSQNSPDLDRLIKLCKDGNELAWEQMFKEFSYEVARWLVRLDYTLGEEDIADLVNDVFLKVLQNLPSYVADQCPFRGWLFLQTESVAIDNLRRRLAKKRIPPNLIVSFDDQPDDGGSGSELPDKAAPPDETAAKREMHRLLFRALDALGPPNGHCRRLITFVYFGGLKYHEAAEVLQMNAKTVSSALSKCLADLRKIWEREFPGGNVPPIKY